MFQLEINEVKRTVDWHRLLWHHKHGTQCKGNKGTLHQVQPYKKTSKKTRKPEKVCAEHNKIMYQFLTHIKKL